MVDGRVEILIKDKFIKYRVIHICRYDVTNYKTACIYIVQNKNVLNNNCDIEMIEKSLKTQ